MHLPARSAAVVGFTGPVSVSRPRRARERAKTAAAIAKAMMLRKKLFWKLEISSPKSSHRRTNMAIRAKPNALAVIDNMPLERFVIPRVIISNLRDGKNRTDYDFF